MSKNTRKTTITRRQFLGKLAAFAATNMILSGPLKFQMQQFESSQNELWETSLNQPVSGKAQKVRIVLSDTHLGAGRIDEGNLLEDFTADQEWVALFKKLTEESDEKALDMEVIINGDWFEYLQVPAVAEFDPQKTYPVEAYEQRTEEAAILQTAVIYEGHRQVFESIASFLNDTSPRRSLTVLFGNHDPELAFKGVQQQIRTYLGATGKQDSLVRFSDRTYFEDGVFIEHGNAYLDPLNRFVNPEAPFDPHNPNLIEHPVGSLFVSNFYNSMERDRYWIDAVLPLGLVLFYGFAFDIPFAMRTMRAMGKVDPQFSEDVKALFQAGTPDTNVERVLMNLFDADETSDETIEAVSDMPRLWRDIAHTLVNRGLIPAHFSQALANDQLKPDQFASLIRQEAEHDLEKTADIVAQGVQADVICFGHSHQKIQKQLPNSKATYLNTGTWINSVDFSDASIEKWQDLMRNPEQYVNQRNLVYGRIEHDAHGKLLQASLYSVIETISQ